MLVLCAHHDAVPGSPGANDNAAAVGILLHLIPRLPADFAVPIVIVLHMPVGYTEMYARRLNDLSALEVVEARERVRDAEAQLRIARSLLLPSLDLGLSWSATGSSRGFGTALGSPGASVWTLGFSSQAPLALMWQYPLARSCTASAGARKLTGLCSHTRLLVERGQ